MTEPSQTPPTHHEHRHSAGTSKTTVFTKYIKPALFIFLAVLLPVVSRQLNSGTVVSACGAACIIVLSVSKMFKLQSGIFLSVVFLLMMVMLNLWHWADTYFISIFTGIIMTDNALCLRGLVEGSVVLVSLWAYYILMSSLKMRVTQEWFVRKSLLKFIVGLFFLHLCLFLLWIISYILFLLTAGNRYHEHDITLAALIIALILTTFSLLVYLYIVNDPKRKHQRHGHH